MAFSSDVHSWPGKDAGQAWLRQATCVTVGENACHLLAWRYHATMTYMAPGLRKANTTSLRDAAKRERWTVPMDEDLMLMRRVATGDRQAFEMLYRRYAQPL